MRRLQTAKRRDTNKTHGAADLPPETTDGAGGPDQARGAWFPVVGVGASAGGLEAFTQLLEALPPDTGMAFVLVQHLDPDHRSALTQILARATSLPVNEITDGEQVRADHVHVIPPDTSLSIAGGVTIRCDAGCSVVPPGRRRTRSR